MHPSRLHTRRRFIHTLAIAASAGLAACAAPAAAPNPTVSPPTSAPATAATPAAPTTAAAATAAPVTATPSTKAFDRSRPLVIASFGGSYATSIEKTYGKLFTDATGVPIQLAGPPSPANIKQMVETNAVEWDVVDFNEQNYLALGPNFFEPLDDSLFDKADLDAIYGGTPRYPGTLFHLVFSTNMAYRTDKLPADQQPKTWADVWDTGRIPGPRSLLSDKASGFAPLEFGLLADGVATDKLYPLDVERAFKSLDRIKPNILKWADFSSQSAELLQRAEAWIVQISSQRVFALKDAGVPVEVNFGQGALSREYFMIPKGAKNKEAAMEFIRVASKADAQAAMAKEGFTGPSHKRAFEFLDAPTKAKLPTSPGNVETQFYQNIEWWLQPASGSNRTNQAVLNERFTQWLLS